MEILSDILELLFRDDVGNTFQDVNVIMLMILRTVIQTTISMDRENPLVVSYWKTGNILVDISFHFLGKSSLCDDIDISSNEYNTL